MKIKMYYLMGILNFFMNPVLAIFYISSNFHLKFALLTL